MCKWFDKLLKLKEKAYVPYSNFHVACICLLKNGQEIIGINVENASYPIGVCAERVCLAQVYSQGYKKEDIKELYLYTDSDNNSSPCGMCRQFIIELTPSNVEIKTYNKFGNVFIFKVNELLPHNFSSSDLGK